jgi:hypothetical protein
MNKDMIMHKEKTTLFSNKWILMALFIVHCSLFVNISAGAQTFTQRLQKKTKGEATVTVHQDKAIEDLVNGPYVAPVQKKQNTTSQHAGQQPAKKSQDQRTDVAQKDTPSPRHQQDTAQHASSASDSLSTTHKASHSYKTMGFRVQVFAGGNSRRDRQKAEQMGNQLRALFPTEAVYVHFYAPRWICRMGNYRSYEEAHQMLVEVKKLGYTASTIVKGKITVAY